MKTGGDKFRMLLSMVIFGTIGIVRKYIPYPSSVIALARGIIGALFLMLIQLYKKERFSKEALKKNFSLLCISGVLLGVNWILLFEAYQYTTLSAATMCYYMAPVFVILVSPLLLGERLTRKKGLCAFIAVCGMILVSGVLETGLSGAIGILFGLGAAALYAAVVLLNKFIKDLSAGERTLFQLAASSAALLPYVLLTEELHRLEGNGFVLLMLVTAGIVHTGIAYTLYFGSLKTIPAQTAALFSYIDPIVAVLLSVTVLKEPLSPLAALGAFLAIGAMIACEYSGRGGKKRLPAR